MVFGMKREYVIGVSIIVIMLCILISGCTDPGVDGDDDDDSGRDFVEGGETLRLSIDDAWSETKEDGAGILTTDDFLRAEQTGGDPIDWTKLTIYCYLTGSDERKELSVLTIAGDEFPGTETESKVGEVIIFGVSTDGDFSNGDYVDIIIVKRITKLYSQNSIRVV
jgi:hypothetical protein